MPSSEVGQGKESEALYVSYPVHTFWNVFFEHLYSLGVLGPQDLCSHEQSQVFGLGQLLCERILAAPYMRPI